MAALNFPSSPVINQIYSANGTVWIYDGTVWLPFKQTSQIPPSTILGRGASITGVAEPLTLGSGLSIIGTTISSTAAGSLSGDSISDGDTLLTGLIFPISGLKVLGGLAGANSLSFNHSDENGASLNKNLNIILSQINHSLTLQGSSVIVSGSNKGDVTLNSNIGDVFNISTQLIGGKSVSKDSLVFWDQSAAKLTFLEPLSGISINGTGISLTDSGVTNSKLAGMAADRVKARIGTSGVPQDATIHQILDLLGTSSRGEIIIKGATQWEKLSPGISGYLLQTRGTGDNPEWVAPPVSTITESTVGYISAFLL